MMDPTNNTNPSENDTPSSLTISPLFCDPDADVTFKSSDGVLFKIHKKHLETASAGFNPPPFVETDEEPVSLQESSEVLEILFRFIHPPTESQKYRQPNLAVDVQPEILFAVAEAAEKYVVFGAMSTCLLRMEHIATGRPLEILNHCHKHGYEELADQVAPHTIALPLTEVAAKLTSPGLLAKWVVYYDHWMELSRFTRRYIQQIPNSGCLSIKGWESEFYNAFAKNPRCVFSPPPLPNSPNCAYNCVCNTERMRTIFLELPRKGSSIPKFTSIQISA